MPCNIWKARTGSWRLQRSAHWLMHSIHVARSGTQRRRTVYACIGLPTRHAADQRFWSPWRVELQRCRWRLSTCRRGSRHGNAAWMSRRSRSHGRKSIGSRAGRLYGGSGSKDPNSRACCTACRAPHLSLRLRRTWRPCRFLLSRGLILATRDRKRTTRRIPTVGRGGCAKQTACECRHRRRWGSSRRRSNVH